MKIIDFEIADNSLTKVTVITEPRMSEKVFQAVLGLMKNLNFPAPSLHQGRLVFPNASCLANQATMNTLKSILEKAAKEVNNARYQEEKRRTQYLNQFRQAAGLPPKEVAMPSNKPKPAPSPSASHSAAASAADEDMETATASSADE